MAKNISRDQLVSPTKINKLKREREHNMETMGAVGDGLYRRLWAIRARFNQRRALTGSWVMPPTTGFIQIKQRGEPYGTFNHGNLRGKTPSLLAPPAMASTAAYGPSASVPLDGAC